MPARPGAAIALQFLLRAATSPTTAPLLNVAIQERFLRPIRDWLGGEDAPARARVLAAAFIGFLVERLIRDQPLAGRERDVFIEERATTLLRGAGLQWRGPCAALTQLTPERSKASLEIAAERGGDLTTRVYAVLFQAPARHASLVLAGSYQWGGPGRDARCGCSRPSSISSASGDTLDHLIQCEVVTHEGYDVPSDVFATFFGLVAEVVNEVCGPEWSPAMAVAWRTLLADLDYYVTHPEQMAVEA